MNNKKNNIFIIGNTGSGKSSIGLELSKKINMNFFDSDIEIEKKLKLSINDIFKYKGEKFFRKKEENIIKKISNKNNIILSTGGGSIESKKNRSVLLSNGIIIFLKVDINNQLKRLFDKKDRPILKDNLKKEEILNKLNNNRNKFYEEIANVIIDTNKKTIINVVDNIVYILNKLTLIKKYGNNKC